MTVNESDLQHNNGGNSIQLDDPSNLVAKNVTFTGDQVATLVRQVITGGTDDGMRVSFEMKQAAKGQKYYDIKVSNIRPDEIEQAIAAYDAFDELLSARALLGE